MRVTLFLTLLLLSACARPLTPGEKSFAHQLFSETITTDRIRFNDGAIIGKVTYKRQKRPRLACRERIWPEPTSETITVGPAAVAIHNKVFYAKPYFSKDYLHGYPESMYLFAAMLFAHELTHVWQWQNREITGYTPIKSANEHEWGEDPYLYDINTKTKFLDYAYEQQASIVEEYVCCTALDPQAPRTKRLESLLKSAFPLGKLRIPKDITIPWDGAQTKGICQ
ncbi:hypothetical protein RXV86_02865 [Alisedimentitalea sp. MJ-SS2]|uniref:hypothetical protein n=1 Tax=Aliisedimentitalea sp. MJ-SS2 TaxID=3049795 RepID=UPI002913D041|nr:hypothetical protein [Alisedimentitalea sp. MJ-SS2]MDU8926316.1 hypothetical protein [Alisedimentitalea sp. MJ-SS2]